MITNQKLEFWIKNNLNVLFIGKHGVGKSARVIDAFNKAGLNWLYFSAATLDPWVDFIGIPKECTDAEGVRHIDLIRPKQFAEDKVEAIFLDEFNRAPKKVRNAVMELIQFKSINGKKFNNLKFIWAAINPEDEDNKSEYDVEKLDPAQKDRFQIIVEVPWKVDSAYFTSKFGDELAGNAINWWTNLSKEEQNGVSPRRLEYIVDIYQRGGDVRDVVPNNINIKKLTKELSGESPLRELVKLFKTKNIATATAFIRDSNNLSDCESKILEQSAYLEFFFPLMQEEQQVRLISNNKKVYQHVANHIADYRPLIESITKTDPYSKLGRKMRRLIQDPTPANTGKSRYILANEYRALSGKHFKRTNEEIIKGLSYGQAIEARIAALKAATQPVALYRD